MIASQIVPTGLHHMAYGDKHSNRMSSIRALMSVSYAADYRSGSGTQGPLQSVQHLSQRIDLLCCHNQDIKTRKQSTILVLFIANTHTY